MGCYLCGNSSTSSEHAPAKCFFPKEKRKNLIKVASCSTHNEDTSKDDKYVRNIIAMAIGNNEVAQKHFLEKCVKSFQESPGLFIATTQEQKEILLVGQNEVPLKSLALQIDRKRFDNVMKKIAYALFFKSYGIIWNKELITVTKSLVTDTLEFDSVGKLIADLIIEKNTAQFEGENQDVFKYMFFNTNPENIQTQILYMVFYEGFEIWIFPDNDSNAAKL